MIRHGIQCALKKENATSERAIMLNVGVREQKWRKCGVVADRLSNELHNFEHNFNGEDKQHVFKRFLNKENVKKFFPKFQWKSRDRIETCPF